MFLLVWHSPITHTHLHTHMCVHLNEVHERGFACTPGGVIGFAKVPQNEVLGLGED